MIKNHIKSILFSTGILGIFLSSYLWYYHEINEIPPCTISGCEDVLTGHYSQIFGIPIAVYGFFYYCFITLLSFQNIVIKNSLIKKSLLIFSVFGLLFTLYLRYLEFFKIYEICMWCWMSLVLVIILIVGSIYNLKY